MRLRAKWSEKVEMQINPLQKGFFGSIKTQVVEKEKFGWLVGTTNISPDINGVTFCNTNYLAILPDNKDKVVFVEAVKVSVQLFDKQLPAILLMHGNS